MEIVVAETDPELMAGVIKAAVLLAGESEGQITVLSVVCVGWPATLASSSDCEECFAGRVRSYAASAERRLNARLIFARDLVTAYSESLEPASVVLIATRSRWWRTWQERLARALARRHFRVVLLRMGMRTWRTSR